MRQSWKPLPACLLSAVFCNVLLTSETAFFMVKCTLAHAANAHIFNLVHLWWKMHVHETSYGYFIEGRGVLLGRGVEFRCAEGWRPLLEHILKSIKKIRFIVLVLWTCEKDAEAQILKSEESSGRDLSSYQAWYHFTSFLLLLLLFHSHWRFILLQTTDIWCSRVSKSLLTSTAFNVSSPHQCFHVHLSAMWKDRN